MDKALEHLHETASHICEYYPPMIERVAVGNLTLSIIDRTFYFSIEGKYIPADAIAANIEVVALLEGHLERLKEEAEVALIALVMESS